MARTIRLIVLFVFCAVNTAAQIPLRLRVVDSVGTEVGTYAGITLFQAGLQTAVLRFVPATDTWVVFPVNGESLALNVPRGRQIRFAATGCSGTPYVLLDETAGLGNPLVTPQLWGGGDGGVYFYAIGPRFTATEQSFQIFTADGDVSACTPDPTAPSFDNAYEVRILDLSGLFTPPFSVSDLPQ